ADRAVADGRGDGPFRARLFPAGTVPAADHRSGADRDCRIALDPRSMNVLVVTPTYNEKDNLPLLAEGVLKHDGFRLLVVDDGSPDGTGAIADRLAEQHPGRVEVIHRTGPRGLGRSYVDGLLHAIKEGTADYICQMDCDLSHDPAYLPSPVATAATNDLVIG